MFYLSEMTLDVCWQCLLALFGIGIILLSVYHQAFRYHLKLYTFFFIVFLSCFVSLPIAVFRPRRVENLNVFSKVGSFLCRWLLGVECEVHGLEHVANDEPFVIVCNHQSALDVYALMVLFPPMKRCTVVSKKELVYIPILGCLGLLSNVIYVDRMNSDKAIGTLNKAARFLVDNKIKLWIFPEGTRSLHAGMLPFKKGGFHIALQAKIPIVPAVISSYKSFYDPKESKFNSGKVIVTVLPPVSTENYTSENVNELIEKVRAPMLETFFKTSNISQEEQNLDDNLEKTKTVTSSENNKNHKVIKDDDVETSEHEEAQSVTNEDEACDEEEASETSNLLKNDISLTSRGS